MTSPLFVLFCSGEHEKRRMAAMMASVAAAGSERPVGGCSRCRRCCASRRPSAASRAAEALHDHVEGARKRILAAYAP